MKILLVHPGASWSIHDVYTGYRKALQRAGHEIIDYALDGRITAAGSWLIHCWKQSGLGPDQKPGPADIMYLSGQGIMEKALNHNVDWTLVVSAMHLHPKAFVLMRRAGLKVAIMMTESPYDDQNQLQMARIVNCTFTNERTSVERFKGVCPSSHYLAHAYDPEVHFPREADDSVEAHDVVFVATGFQERCDMLRAVDWDGIDLGLYGSWRLLGSRNWLRKYIRHTVIPNERAVALYRRAKVGLNIHRTSVGWGRKAPRVTDAESMNPRVLELAASETFCLSDWRDEMGDVFGDYVPRFTDGASLQEALFIFLGDPDARAQVSRQMCKDVQGQTFDVRAKQVVKALEDT